MTTWTDVLVLRLRGSADVQTAQAQPIMGTPWEVPLPRTITSILLPATIGPGSPQGTKKKAPRPFGWDALEFFSLAWAQ
jgi:hypothetical protein